jgi:hypothetical protein
MCRFATSYISKLVPLTWDLLDFTKFSITRLALLQIRRSYSHVIHVPNESPRDACRFQPLSLSLPPPTIIYAILRRPLANYARRLPRAARVISIVLTDRIATGHRKASFPFNPLHTRYKIHADASGLLFIKTKAFAGTWMSNNV